MELNWSPTDAALAYYLTKNSRNDNLRAHYKRVRVAQKLLGVVDAAFFGLLSLQERLPLARKQVGLRSRVMTETGRLYRKKLKSIEEYHRVRQSFVRSSDLQLELEEQVDRQRAILAAAMGVAPDGPTGKAGFEVAGTLSPPIPWEEIAIMETRGVMNRPESFEAGLDYLSAVNDLKRTFVKYMPKLSGFFRVTRDKDRYLYNKDWKETGVQLRFDLTDWLENMQESGAARSNAAKKDSAAAVAILGIAAEVRLAALKYKRLLGELDNARRSLNGSMELLEAKRIKAEQNDITHLALLESEADALGQRINVNRILGEINQAWAEVSAAMGVNYREPHPAH